MTSDGYQGPQTIAADQLEAVIGMVDHIFGRENTATSMRDQFPMLYNSDHVGNMRVFMREGRPVSALGLTVCDVVALGCTTRIGCIGSVCTDESARGSGLAGRLVSDARDRAAAHGAAVILISGRRGLYERHGAVDAGLFHHYTFAADGLVDGGSEVTAGELAEGEATIALAMYESEPVRFVNSERDYLAMIASGQTMTRPGKTYLVRRRGKPAAVVSVNCSRAHDDKDKNVLGVREMAGCRQAMFAALPQILAHTAPAAGTVQIDAYASDEQTRSACAAMGATPEEKAHCGTLLLVDPRRLLRDFAPLLAERIGPRDAAMLSVQPIADEMKINALTFSMGDDKLTIEGAERFTAALFGRPGDDTLAELSGPLAEILHRALPLPLPLYGLRYV